MIDIRNIYTLPAFRLDNNNYCNGCLALNAFPEFPICMKGGDITCIENLREAIAGIGKTAIKRPINCPLIKVIKKSCETCRHGTDIERKECFDCIHHHTNSDKHEAYV